MATGQGNPVKAIGHTQSAPGQHTRWGLHMAVAELGTASLEDTLMVQPGKHYSLADRTKLGSSRMLEGLQEGGHSAANTPGERGNRA